VEGDEKQELAALRIRLESKIKVETPVSVSGEKI
jgi:hypothetical protein